MELTETVLVEGFNTVVVLVTVDVGDVIKRQLHADDKAAPADSSNNSQVVDLALRT